MEWKGSNEPRSSGLIERGRRYYVPVFKPRDVVIDRGQGARVWDVDGREYVDLGSGIAVSSLGHQDPELVEALLAQARKLWHTSNIYFSEPTIRLAEELVTASFAERVFFCNSGGEANEAAIKLARKHASRTRPPEQREIITFEGSFHGRTLATVTATAQPKYHEGFEPLPAGFTYCPFNDFKAIEARMSERTCAVLVEPVQGEGGIIEARPGFLAHLQALCRKHGALLMFDEVQCGMGRTGRLFGYQWEEGVTPDVVTLAKGLAGGVPIGVMLAGPQVAETLQFGSHGTTFGGNPLAAAAARVVLRRVQTAELQANVERQGQRLRERLHAMAERFGRFREVRGRGLMVGAELQGDWEGTAGELTERCRDQGVLVLQAGPNVLRFLPPLTVTDEELDQGLSRVESALAGVAPR